MQTTYLRPKKDQIKQIEYMLCYLHDFMEINVNLFFLEQIGTFSASQNILRVFSYGELQFKKKNYLAGHKHFRSNSDITSNIFLQG